MNQYLTNRVKEVVSCFDTIEVQISSWPLEYYDVCQSALQLKREHKYEEALLVYLNVFFKYKFKKEATTTELVRAMAKTLCTLCEYNYAYQFYRCAIIPYMNMLFEHPDCYSDKIINLMSDTAIRAVINALELFSNIHEAALGKVDSLKKLTIGMACADSSFYFMKSDAEIIAMAQSIDSYVVEDEKFICLELESVEQILPRDLTARIWAIHAMLLCERSGESLI